MQPHQTTYANDQLAYAIDAAELATWEFDPKTGTLTGNSRLKDWFGLDGDGPVPLQLADAIIAGKDRLKVAEAIRNALSYSSGGVYEIEYTIINAKTKQERVIRAKGKALFGEDQTPYRFNGILMDITKEVSAREQRQKLLKLVDNSVDLMSLLELNGINSYINAAGREILGIDADADVTVIPINDFHNAEQIAFVQAEIIPNVMGKGKWAGQFAICNAKTGEIIPLYNNCHRIDDPNTGEPIGIGAVMRDMRPELNARQELEKKVKERTLELQTANDELEKKNIELASFAYVASHDLQEPLRKIRTFSERILAREADNLSETGQDYFRRIDKAAERMQALINDLLSFSKTGTEQGQIEDVDLSQLVQEVLADLGDDIKTKNAVIVAEGLCNAHVISFQFRQLLANLIGNALKFSKPDESPRVSIRSKIIDIAALPADGAVHHGQYCHLNVTDNGIGFDQQYAERIFELFQRLHGRQDYEGTGIGLAIVKKIVSNHHGIIRASSEPGKGASFDIYIPH
jgi:PAS domain S-box-containing protein